MSVITGVDSKAIMLKSQPMSLVAGTGREPLAAAKIRASRSSHIVKMILRMR
jgi:hypothetical protein